VSGYTAYMMSPRDRRSTPPRTTTCDSGRLNTFSGFV